VAHINVWNFRRRRSRRRRKRIMRRRRGRGLNVVELVKTC
jgi:hypothetical protein